MNSHFSFCNGIILSGSFAFTPNITFRPIKIAFKPEELRFCSGSAEIFGIMCALSATLTLEIATTGDNREAASTRIWNSQWICVWLAIYADVKIHQPFQSVESAENFAKGNIGLLSLVGFHRMFDNPVTVSHGTLEHAKQLWPRFEKLISDHRFAYASAVVVTSQNEPRKSVAIASIWSAIESLLGFDHELSFRISLAIARLLETDMNAKQRRFNSVKKLYNIRSLCVHGAASRPVDEAKGLEASLRLLKELIIFFTRRGALMTKLERERLFL